MGCVTLPLEYKGPSQPYQRANDIPQNWYGTMYCYGRCPVIHIKYIRVMGDMSLHVDVDVEGLFLWEKRVVVDFCLLLFVRAIETKHHEFIFVEIMAKSVS